MYYPLTSSISNGLLAMYGSDERIINNNNNNVSGWGEAEFLVITRTTGTAAGK
jgi:hypothetical protein